MSFLLLSWFRASVVSACFFMVNTFLPTEEIWYEELRMLFLLNEIQGWDKDVLNV